MNVSQLRFEERLQIVSTAEICMAPTRLVAVVKRLYHAGGRLYLLHCNHSLLTLTGDVVTAVVLEPCAKA